MPLKFLLTTKNKKQLQNEGYLYNKKTNNKDSITWRCISHQTLHCSAIIHTNNEKRNGKLLLILFQDSFIPTN